MSRELTHGEREVIALCHEKHAADPRDEVFFLSTGEAVLQVWGQDGDGPWVHLTNLAGWLADGTVSRQEVRDHWL